MSADTETPFAAGDVIDGRYLLEEAIASTNFSWIYKAVQRSTRQPVAVKILRTSALAPAARDEVEQRFERETAIYAQLRHPNVVRLLDTGSFEDNLFVVLDYIEGTPLSQVLHTERSLDPFEAKRLLGQCLDALCAGHARGIVHRDVKPANVMISSQGGERTAVLLDFGLAGVQARLRDDASRGGFLRPITSPGMVMGTPYYMAPEQIEGETTERSDIFSWAMVTIECLIGRRPNPDRGNLASLSAELKKPIELPPWLSSHPLGRLLSRATELDPERRYPNAEAVLNDLRSCPVADLVPVAPAPVRVDEAPDDSILGTVEIAHALDSDLMHQNVAPSLLIAQLGELGSQVDADGEDDRGPAVVQDLDRLFESYLRVSRVLGLAPELEREAFVDRARLDAAWLRAALDCRAVRFRLLVDDGEVRLQPVPVS